MDILNKKENNFNELMGDEILSLYYHNNVQENKHLNAGFILSTFKASLSGLQAGMDYLISKGFIIKDRNNKGNYILTNIGFNNKANITWR